MAARRLAQHGVAPLARFVGAPVVHPAVSAPIQTRRLPGPTLKPDHPPLEVGDFMWGDEYPDGTRRLYIRLPNTSASGFDSLKVFKGADRGIEREWGWDGNEDRPTLVPSILNEGEWHGHLQDGELRGC